MKKPLILTGHAAFLVTALLSILFYKERSLFVDSGQLIFEMLNEGSFKVFLGRYSMYITEIFPWLAIKAGASLKTILIIFSLSFISIQYLCFLICICGFKNVEAGLSIAFAPLLIRITFGQAVCEPWMAIAYSALFYALFNHFKTFQSRGKTFQILFYLLLFFVIGLNYFMHPLALFMVLFAVFFQTIDQKLWRKPHVYASAFLILLMLFSKFLMPQHTYEARYFEGLKEPWKAFPELHTSAMLLFIARYFGELFIFFLIPFIVSMFFFVRRKKFLLVFFCITFCLAYILLITLATYKSDSDMLLEIRLVPLIFMALIPFGIVIQHIKKPILGISGLVILSGISYVHIINSMHRNHTRRINTYRYFLNETKTLDSRKFFVRLPHLQTSVNSWGSAAETLMLTSLEGPAKSKTIIFIDNDMHIEEGIHSYNCMFLWLKWRLYVDESTYLNKKYFNLQCTPYTEIPFPDRLK